MKAYIILVNSMKRSCLSLIFALGLVGCASNQPVLYPNTKLQTAGKAQADIDIAECKHMAEEAGASPTGGTMAKTARRTVTGGAAGAATGAVGGAIAGHTGRGVKIGAATGATAALIRSALREPAPNPTYRRFVQRCLQDRGYDIVGWE